MLQLVRTYEEESYKLNLVHWEKEKMEYKFTVGKTKFSKSNWIINLQNVAVCRIKVRLLLLLLPDLLWNRMIAEQLLHSASRLSKYKDRREKMRVNGRTAKPQRGQR